MVYKYQYTSEIDRQTIMDAHKDLTLIEDQTVFADDTHTTKNKYLIFSDTKPVEAQLQEQADNQLTIMEALADIYAALPPTV